MVLQNNIWTLPESFPPIYDNREPGFLYQRPSNIQVNREQQLLVGNIQLPISVDTNVIYKSNQRTIRIGRALSINQEERKATFNCYTKQHQDEPKQPCWLLPQPANEEEINIISVIKADVKLTQKRTISKLHLKHIQSYKFE